MSVSRATLAHLLFALSACRALDPPNKPETTCVQACRDRTTNRCTDNECGRGCRLALDRIIEHEGENVIKCVADAKNKRCDDFTWAECAARIGIHADGGPPVPQPGKEDFDEDD